MLSLTNRRPRPHSFGPTLHELIDAAGVLQSGPAPRFPSSLLAAEKKLTDAIEGRGPAEAVLAAEALTEAIVAQLDSDHHRFDDLPQTPEHYHERAFLANRLLVLRTRLVGLSQTAPADTRTPSAVPQRTARPALRSVGQRSG